MYVYQNPDPPHRIPGSGSTSASLFSWIRIYIRIYTVCIPGSGPHLQITEFLNLDHILKNCLPGSGSTSTPLNTWIRIHICIKIMCISKAGLLRWIQTKCKCYNIALAQSCMLAIVLNLQSSLKMVKNYILKKTYFV